MLLNDLEKDIKIKCIENDTTQIGLAEKIGKTGQYVNRIVKKNGGVLNKTFIQMMEGLGYDIQLTYVKRQTYNAIESGRKEMNWAIYCSLLLYFDYHPNAHTIIHQLNIFPAWLENTRLYIDANE